MQLYVHLNGARRGPFSEERVRGLLVDGLLQASDLASEQPDRDWRPLSDLVAPPPPPPPPAVQPTAQPTIVNVEPPPAIEQLPRAVIDDLPRLAPDTLGPYSRSTLAPDETPCYKTSLHWVIFLRFAALAAVLFLFAAIPFAIAIQAVTGSEIGWFALPLPALLLLPPAVAFASSELVITDRRVLIKTGVIRRQTLELFISKIESIAIDQGFFGRLLDYGSVTIRGTGGFEEPFEAIARPILFRNWVQRLQGGVVPPLSANAAQSGTGAI